MSTAVLLTDQGAGTRVDLSWTPLDATPEEEAFFASRMGSMDAGRSGSFEPRDRFRATG
ncbi:hypothetical protein [Salinarimonas soli]|uniref:hypothetical protein n=1 Tax=Salinarimonas soli TaxID=1638099 RepID=UPI0016619375|nr:hypothetical protein [Salinarimonas soli]